jgi:hypothetical protein
MKETLNKRGDKYGKCSRQKVPLHQVRCGNDYHQGRRRHDYLLRPTHGNQTVKNRLQEAKKWQAN